MTHATRPPAAKQHTLIAGRKLGKGEFSIDIPRDLVTRHGPYKVLNPSEALLLAVLLAGICSLRPGKYVSKSRLFKAAGMDINQGRNVLARLVEKGFILEVGHSWMPVIPERDEQPTAEQQEQPAAKKEEKEEASPTTEQPPTAKTTPRLTKVMRSEVSAATSPVSHLVDVWNEHVNIGRKDVDAGAFPPQVVEYINTFCTKYDIDPAEFVTEAARCLHWEGDGRYIDATPSFVFNSKGAEYHRSLFYDQVQAASQRLVKQQEEQQWQAAYKGILGAASEQGAAAPTFERMALGWSEHHQYRTFENCVALRPDDVATDVRVIVKDNTCNETRDGLMRVYGTPAPSDQQRHQRQCELLEKVFYAFTSIVGAENLTGPPLANAPCPLELVLEAVDVS